MIKNWLLYLMGLLGALIFYIYYFGWFSWFILILLLCMPLFSLVVSILAMVRVRLLLDVPQRCTRGDPAYVTLRALGSFLPLPRCRFRLVVRSAMTGQELVLKQQAPGQDSWYVPLDTAHCGVLRCSLAKARIYDYLGLFGFPVRLPEAKELMVRPAPVQPEKLPNLSHFLVRRRRPKPGGGFSEEHDLRDYRPGDSMRDIHWKLSVKTDRTIVREPQEPVRGLTLLTFDLCGLPDQVDDTLERLLWLSNWLLEHDTPHQILWIDPEDCEMAQMSMETMDDWEPLLERLLHTALREDTPSIANRRFAGASWRCHVGSGELL